MATAFSLLAGNSGVLGQV